MTPDRLAQLPAQDLADRAFRQLVHEVHMARRLVAREVLTAMGDELLLGQARRAHTARNLTSSSSLLRRHCDGSPPLHAQRVQASLQRLREWNRLSEFARRLELTAVVDGTWRRRCAQRLLHDTGRKWHTTVPWQ